jgi:hypothetical protein
MQGRGERVPWTRRHEQRRIARSNQLTDGLAPSPTAEQQSRFSWIGGHATDPNEQKTQQSPDLGFNSSLQWAHS